MALKCLGYVTGVLRVGFVCVLLADAVNADTRICRLQSIQGLEAVHDRAQQLISPTTTSDPREMKVYLSVEQGKLYAQSNFRNEGMKYPTKLYSDEDLDRASLLAVTLAGADSRQTQEQVLEAMPSITWVVDKNLFTDKKYGKLDFGSSSVLVVGVDGVKRPSKLVLSLLSKKRIVSLTDHVFASIEDTGMESLVNALQKKTFDPDSVGIMPLVQNGATLEMLQSIPNKNRATISEFSVEDVQKQVSRWKGKTLFMLGHVESGAFVTRDARGDIIMTVPIKDIQDFGKSKNVNVVAVGCNSAAVSSLGVANSFNTVDAMAHFSAALKSQTWLEFLSNVAGRDLDLLVDGTVVDQTGNVRVSISVYRSRMPYFIPAGGMAGTLLPNGSTGYPWYVWVGGGVLVLFLIGKMFGD